MRRLIIAAGFIGAVVTAALMATNVPSATTNADTSILRRPTFNWPEVTEQECKTPPRPNQPGPKPVPVAPQVQGVQGADVAEYEGVIDWDKLGAQKKFVFMRYSHGGHVDVFYHRYFSEAKRVGVIKGVYHYLDPADPTPFADQLKSFVANVKLEKGDLPPVLDLENPCLWVHLTVAERITYVKMWANAFEKVYGVKPIIYMSASFVDRALGGANNIQFLKDYPLWIANYNVAKPLVPLPWQTYIIWQYSESAPLAGVSIPADADIAPGTLADLQKWGLPAAAGGDVTILTKDDLNDHGLVKKK